MIEVTVRGKSGRKIYLNPHVIEYIEGEGESTIVLLSGKRLVVQEDFSTISKRIIEYRRQIGAFKNEE